MLSANAFNWWGLVFGIDFSRTDQGMFLGLTYKLWGIILFLLFISKAFYKFVVKELTIERLFYVLLTLTFGSFLFMTNMHERYLYPLFPYLAILTSLHSLPFSAYLVISLIHLLNLYNLWFYPRVNIIITLLEKGTLLTQILSVTLLLIGLYSAYLYEPNSFSKKKHIPK